MLVALCVVAITSTVVTLPSSVIVCCLCQCGLHVVSRGWEAGCPVGRFGHQIVLVDACDVQVVHRGSES